MTDVLQHNVNIRSPMASRSPVVMDTVSKSPLHSLIEKLTNTSKRSTKTEEEPEVPEKDLEESTKDAKICSEFSDSKNESNSGAQFNTSESKHDFPECRIFPGAVNEVDHLCKDFEHADGEIESDKADTSIKSDSLGETGTITDKNTDDSEKVSEDRTKGVIEDSEILNVNTETKFEPDADIDTSDSDGMDTDVCNEIKERALKVKNEQGRITSVNDRLRRKDITHSYGNYVGRSARNFDDDLPFTDDDSDDDRSVSVASKDPIFMFTKFNTGLHKDKKELLKFAEVLYKCTLCTSIPSILTSEESFLQHVKEQHLCNEDHYHGCKMCSLKLRTEEDLKEHVIDCHTENDDNMSCDLTGSDIIKSYDHMMDSNNESDSDSSGHRQLRAKVVKRNKPIHDFESPKQLVDHTGIETLNGSLDLSQKNVKLDEKRDSDKSRSPLSGNDGSEIDIKQITDQIIKSDVQGRNVNNNSSAKLPFIPSFTPEFGKYTKLVREGGNIVYFCQVCNWKSPIKTTFQVHCNSSSHKSKVSAAENPDENYDSPPRSSKSEKNAIPCRNEHAKDKTSGKHPSSQDVPFGPKMPDHSLFYNYIMRPRGVSHCRRRTPIVSPYGTSNFIEDARFTYKRPNEYPVDLAVKKRKRLAKYVKQGNNSESDSDEDKSVKQGPSTKASHLSSMTLLRQKLLEGSCARQNYSSKSAKNSHNEQNFPTDLSTNDSRKLENGKYKNYPYDAVNVDAKDYSEFNKCDFMYRQSHTEHTSDSMYRSDKRNFAVSQFEGNASHFTKDRDKSAGKQYRCFACSFEYNEVDDYERHFDKVHKGSYSNYYTPKRDSLNSHRPMWMQGAASSAWTELAGAGSRFRTDTDGDTRHERNGEPASTVTCEMGENWRVQKLKEILPDYVVECERGNTSRDYLLQCVSSASGMQDAVLWSSACNRAMRELFPNSQAQRKGKYKKTYYFGISMLDTYHVPEDIPCADGESPLYQPHRDINVDMEKIVEHLPSILKWTGNMENGVHRQDLLMVLADAIQDAEVGNWGAQCNRALRLVFPHVDMKRKGKYKTTMYLGVEFHKDVQKTLARYSSNFGDRSCTKSPSTQYTDTHPATAEPKRSRTLESLLSKDSDSPDIVHNECSEDRLNSGVTNYQEFMKSSGSKETAKVAMKFEDSLLFETKSVFSDAKSVSDNVEVNVEQCDDNDGDDEEESMDN